MEQSSCAEADSFSVKEFFTFHEIRKFTKSLIINLIFSLNEPDKSISPLSFPFLNIPFDTNLIPTPRPSKSSPHSGDPKNKKIYIRTALLPISGFPSILCMLHRNLIPFYLIVITLYNTIKQRVHNLFNALKLHTETPILKVIIFNPF
jgi:hypothetical protein